MSIFRKFSKKRLSKNGGNPLLSDLKKKEKGSDVTTSFVTDLRKEKQKETKHRLLQSKANSVAETSIDGEVCLIEHSPYRILKVAAKGDVQEFERLYHVDPSRLNVQDLKGFGSLHHAAAKGKTAIIEFIHSHGGDLNIRDLKGNTPLHTAIENQQKESIDCLVSNGADTAAKNDKQSTPLILAIELSLVDIVEVLLKRKEVNPQDTGENGASPLHYCAHKDEAECAKLLIAYGAKPCHKCDNGFYPIHVAAYHGSSKTMDVLIEYGESVGYTRAQMLSFSDKEHNNPLHAAVNSGDLQAVRVCLVAGAAVDAQQEDKSTPVHFAASQGSVEMINLMFKMEPASMSKAVNVKDSLGMSPLHRAAIFNHEPVVKIFIQNGADINALDSQNRTPLMVAAGKGGWATARMLLQSGALINVQDQQNRNFLHLAIKSGARLHQFGCQLIKDIKNLLNEKDDFGCTPLHYASKEGYLSAIEDLIGLGAMLNPKDNQKQSPFHFAARYGRYNTCRRLLDSEQGVHIINESDNTGRSALHIAAENGHAKIISLLMQRGSSVHKDFNGNCPLHLAAANGYTKSIRLILSLHCNLLDSQNRDLNTALHLAASEGHTAAVTLLLTLGAKLERNDELKSFFDFILNSRNSDAAMAVVTHDRWREVMEMCSQTYSCSMIGLIQQLPEVAMVVLDRCQAYSEHDQKHKDFTITYNFKYLQCPISYIREQNKLGNDIPPMMALNAMVKFGRVECLSHPVCVNFLKMKWNAYGLWFHFLNLGIYVVFLSLLTRFVSIYTPIYETETVPALPKNDTNSSSFGFTPNVQPLEISTTSRVTLFIILIFCLLNMIKELGQMAHQKKRYFMDHTNSMEWALYLTTTVFVIPFLVDHSYQWEAGALAVFLAWFNLLLYLQRFDFFGIYVVMFLEILSTLLNVLCVFSILIVAFGLSFYMLLGQEASKAHSTPGLSLLRTAMMMLELDYMESFNTPYTDDDPNTLHFNKLTIFMLVLFVLLMPILLMNLLIGLAVGDIEAVQRDARLKRLAMQVDHHTDLERKLPQKILERVDKVEYTVNPNCGRQVMMSLLLKVTSAADDNFTGDNICRGSEVTSSRLYEEMFKQKQRMKEMSSLISKQHDLLRLVVQKMEIDTEDDYRDEGAVTSDSMESLKSGISQSKPSGWNRPGYNILKKSAVISKWKSVNK